jgi:hypothetical protein
MTLQPISPLTRQRAVETIRIVARAVQAGEPAVTYSELAERLGMSRVNGQGLASYLALASRICLRHGLPNTGALVVSKASLDAGAPMPSEGSFSDAFYEASGLTAAGIPAEQAKVRAFDWDRIEAIDLDAD